MSCSTSELLLNYVSWKLSQERARQIKARSRRRYGRIRGGSRDSGTVRDGDLIMTELVADADSTGDRLDERQHLSN